jgi:hypothetical protein
VGFWCRYPHLHSHRIIYVSHIDNPSWLRYNEVIPAERPRRASPAHFENETMKFQNSPAVKAAIAKITPEMINGFWEKMAEQAESRRAFFGSDLCKRIAADVAAADAGFGCEDVSYCFDELTARFGWTDLTKEDLSMFIQAMSDMSFGVDSMLSDPIEDNPFDHAVCLKGGLLVFSMHGQGSEYWVEPVSARPELHEKLLRAMESKEKVSDGQ